MISALPDIKRLTLTTNDEFMVLACDGIWNSMTSTEVVKFVKAKLTENLDISLKQICEEVILRLNWIYFCSRGVSRVFLVIGSPDGAQDSSRTLLMDFQSTSDVILKYF